MQTTPTHALHERVTQLRSDAFQLVDALARTPEAANATVVTAIQSAANLLGAAQREIRMPACMQSSSSDS